VLTLGIAFVIAALDARAILEREIDASYAKSRAPDLALWLEGVEPGPLALVAAQEGVAGVDARRVINTRVTVTDGTWMPMRLTIRAAGAPESLGRVHTHESTGAAAGGAIRIEQSGASLIDARVTGALRARKAGGEAALLPFGGFVHDPSVAPSTQERMIFAYGTPATAAALGHAGELDQLLVKMDYRGSAGEVAEFGTRLAKKLADAGSPPLRVEVLAATHPHAMLMTAMLRVLAVLSMLAFAASAAIAGYLVSAWMRREVRLVGVLKTLGARTHQVAAQYFALALPLVAVSLAIAVPLGSFLGRLFARWEAIVINVDLGSLDVPYRLAAQELAFALGIPLLAMALPILRAVRITPRAAIHDPGIAALPFAARLATRLPGFQGRVAQTLALRNVWRRPWRTAAMVLALASGGALLLTSKTNYDSLMGAADRALANEGHDVEVFLQRPAPAAELEQVAASVPGVAIAEAWRRASLSMAPASPGTRIDHEGMRLTLVGYPDRSRLFRLPVVEGSLPVKQGEVLVTKALRNLQPDLAVGQELHVRFRDRRAAVHVAGFVEQIGTPAMYTSFGTFEEVTALGDGSLAVRVRGGAAGPEALALALDQAFLDAGRAPAQVISKKLVRDALDEHIDVVGGVMSVVALAAALVGAIVLVATVVFNVFERRREIGILRAIGATEGRIRAIFAIEAAAVTLASGAIAIAGALLMTRAMLDVAERSLLRVTVPMQVSFAGIAILAAGVLVVAAATTLALRYALRGPVREALVAD
jgi:putative ABC transport system permease protein